MRRLELGIDDPHGARAEAPAAGSFGVMRRLQAWQPLAEPTARLAERGVGDRRGDPGDALENSRRKEERVDPIVRHPVIAADDAAAVALRIPGHADRRREVVPVVLVQFPLFPSQGGAGGCRPRGSDSVGGSDRPDCAGRASPHSAGRDRPSRSNAVSRCPAHRSRFPDNRTRSRTAFRRGRTRLPAARTPE